MKFCIFIFWNSLMLFWKWQQDGRNCKAVYRIFSIVFYRLERGLKIVNRKHLWEKVPPVNGNRLFNIRFFAAGAGERTAATQWITDLWMNNSKCFHNDLDTRALPNCNLLTFWRTWRTLPRALTTCLFILHIVLWYANNLIGNYITSFKHLP